ncbi:MAG: hypothetical protein OHK0022_23610 [Roseiflexaceae bacterium]
MARSTHLKRKPATDTTASNWPVSPEQPLAQTAASTSAPASAAAIASEPEAASQTGSFGHSFAAISLFSPALDQPVAPPEAPSDPTVQASLRINAPGDSYEQQAEHMADLVMRMPADPESSPAPADTGPQIQRAASGDIGGVETSPAVDASIAQMQSGGGNPLPASERSFFEGRFGHDFSQIRIHADSHAAETAQSLNARAFTVGTDIAFGPGEYQPGTSSGRHLLAHELTHTIQQTGGIATKRIQRKVAPDEQQDEAAAPPEPAPGAIDTGKAAASTEQAASPGAPAAPAPAPTAAAPASAPAAPALAPAAAPTATAPVPGAPAVVALDAGAAQAQPTATAAAPASTTGEQQASATLDEARRLHEQLAALAQGKAPAGQLVQRTPRSPDADPDFQNVKASITTTATQQKQHAPAEQKANEAAAAAQMPPEERLGQAQNTQAEAINSAATAQEQAAQGDSAPGFDKAAFVAAVKARIDELTPSDPKEMEDIEGSGVFTDTKQVVDDQVATGKETAQGDVDDKVEEAPNPGAVPDKPVTALAANDAGAQPQADASAAAPKPQGTDVVETPLLAESQALDQQMADAQVTPEMLQNSNEAPFQEAMTAKTDAQTKVAADLPAYRTQEQGQIATAQTDAQGLGETGVQGMFDTRGQLFGELDSVQGTGKTDDEAKRAEIGRQIDTIYQTTKTDVEQILTDMDTAVDQCFSTGAERAKQSAIDYIKRETDAFKAERYNRDADWWRVDQHVAGAVTQAWDTLTDMPPEYYEYYRQGRDQYVAEMEIVLGDVADIVGDHLTRARTRINDGRQQIQDYITGLPAELQTVAQETADAAQGKFDALEQQVDSKQQELVNSLAERYNTAVQDMDAALAQMQEADKGLLARAKDLVSGVLGTIADLKAMLEGVLARAAGVVMQILANPIQFISNLISGVGQGLNNFLGNIANHLQTGFIEWLTGTMGGLGVQIPQTLDLPGIFSLAMQVLGMTYDNLRQRAVGMFGETVVGALETGFEIFVILTTEGLPGVWQWIQEHLSSLQEMVLDGIKEMLLSEVLEAGIKWLIGILGGPAGAFIKACMAIYDIVMWFVNNGSRLMGLVDAVIDSVAAIASGDLGGAAQAVEDALGRAVPVTIGFLASLLGLGDLATKVRRVVDRVQEPINNAIEYLLGLVRGFVQKVARMLGLGGMESAGGAQSGIGKEVSFAAGDDSHRLWVDKQGSAATLMVASTPQPVDAQLDAWERNVSNLPEDQQSQAQGLLGQARNLLSGAEQDADFLAQKQQTVKKLEDGDLIEQRQNELEGDQDQLAGVLRQLFELFGDGSLPEGEIVNLPFSLAGEGHTLSVEHYGGQIEVYMASYRDKVSAKYDSTRRMLSNYRRYLAEVQDEQLREELTVMESLINESIESQIPEYTDQMKNARTTDRPGILEEIKNHAESLKQEIINWSQLSFPDLTPDAVERILNERAQAVWERAWHAKQALVTSVVQPYVGQIEALASDAEVQIRGSLAKGVRSPAPEKLGPNGERMRFDPEDFDVDMYVASDELIDMALSAGARTRTRGRPGQIWASRSGIPELQSMVQELGTRLTDIAGARSEFDIIIRSKENQQATIADDRRDAQSLGLDPSRGDPITVTKPES